MKKYIMTDESGEPLKNEDGSFIYEEIEEKTDIKDEQPIKISNKELEEGLIKKLELLESQIEEQSEVIKKLTNVSKSIQKNETLQDTNKKKLNLGLNLKTGKLIIGGK